MTGQRQYRYTFGPVPSRRLGRSLGVDLVPFKACPFDCIYCQLGPTTRKTDRREDFAPVEEVLAEVADRLARDPACCDAITLSGSGEPTLHRSIGRVIAGIKAMTKIPVVVLTNGALLTDPEVRRGLLAADIVMPDLDAGDEQTFRRVNRPCPHLTLAGIVEGLEAFRREYAGTLAVEVFLVTGVNDDEEGVRRIAEILRRVRPDRIEVNTVARPPAEPDARAVPPERLARLAERLGPNARVVAPRPGGEGAGTPTEDDVLALLRRRPCTADDVATGLKAGRPETLAVLTRMLENGCVSQDRRGDKVFYLPRHTPGGPPPGT